MTTTIVVSTPNNVYWRRLRALGAWWRLGSSTLKPELIVAHMEYQALREGYTPCDVSAGRF